MAVTVVDPRWVVPVAPTLVTLADAHDLVITIEDGIITGGIGSMIATAMSDAGVFTPIRHLAFPQIFPHHATRDELLAEVGLDNAGCVQSAVAWVDELFPPAASDED